jgi:hypothetical protein
MKLTEWFPEHIKPVRVGVYEVLTVKFTAPNFRYWNGKFWSATYGSARLAKKYGPGRDFYQYSVWRGIAK